MSSEEQLRWLGSTSEKLIAAELDAPLEAERLRLEAQRGPRGAGLIDKLLAALVLIATPFVFLNCAIVLGSESALLGAAFPLPIGSFLRLDDKRWPR